MNGWLIFAMWAGSFAGGVLSRRLGLDWYWGAVFGVPGGLLGTLVWLVIYLIKRWV